MAKGQHILVFLMCVCFLAVQGAPTHDLEEGPLQYRFHYAVQNNENGDYKTQEEARHGDTVKGKYTVGEPNGDLRVVTYTADKQRGFQAEVEVVPGGTKLINTNQPSQSHVQKLLPANKGDVKLDEEIEHDEKEKVDQIRGASEGEGKGGTRAVRSEKVEEIKCTLKCHRKSPKGNNNEPESRMGTNEDKVQVEMEQVIRAEMEDPPTVNLGIPIHNLRHIFRRPILDSAQQLMFVPQSQVPTQAYLLSDPGTSFAGSPMTFASPAGIPTFRRANVSGTYLSDATQPTTSQPTNSQQQSPQVGLLGEGPGQTVLFLAEKRWPQTYPPQQPTNQPGPIYPLQGIKKFLLNKRFNAGAGAAMQSPQMFSPGAYTLLLYPSTQQQVAMDNSNVPNVNPFHPSASAGTSTSSSANPTNPQQRMI